MRSDHVKKKKEKISREKRIHSGAYKRRTSHCKKKILVNSNLQSMNPLCWKGNYKDFTTIDMDHISRKENSSNELMLGFVSTYTLPQSWNLLICALFESMIRINRRGDVFLEQMMDIVGIP